MNRSELVDAVATQVGDRRLAATTVEAVLDTVTRAVAEGERVAISGFGVFEKADRAARTARNPATGGTVQVPATSVPRFRAGQGFKDAVSGARALPEVTTVDGTAAPAPAARRSTARRAAPAPESLAVPEAEARAARPAEEEPVEGAVTAKTPEVKSAEVEVTATKAGRAKASKREAGKDKAPAGKGKPSEVKAGKAKAGGPKAGKAKAGGPKAGKAKAGGPKAGKAKAGKAKGGKATSR